MNRPMPEPPECVPTGFPHDGAAINAPGCLLHARSYHANSKRLTDVECWAEHHHADAAWAKAMLQVLMGYRPMTDELNAGLHRQLHETGIWRRFATRPHALEVQE